MRGHHDADKDGYVLEHRYVLEKHLLKNHPHHTSIVDSKVDWGHWVAHHKNGDKADNRVRNLQILERGKHHSWMHYREEAQAFRNEIARLQRILDEHGMAY